MIKTDFICVLCGKRINPYQVSDASPVTSGPCCVSCHYGIVYPTQRNNGRLSRWATKRNENGKLVYYFAEMNATEQQRLKERIAELQSAAKEIST